ncbi:peptidoglycan DD-metalloendopeptidase family protein [Flavihumibacter profundi]|uniref:peptidoglycan DD-metalloendopeptidase family protein n=1 Tax=Flavihumibacter profundi TaxID=2716883 RepID=UPI001CC6ECCF|nr:peptidoglycan DD-metalloendopeptidase family protein [Flavihumibacter profundi]MBZ5858135.1 peptidoglycan DD-metalloendopeptidase family protein [Flavihumibacter profundi]
MHSPLAALLLRHQSIFHQVVRFNPLADRLASLDLSGTGTDLPPGIAEDLPAFCRHMEQLRKDRAATYLLGGYGELRSMYNRSPLFEDGREPRRLHLGTDIWAPAGTPVFAFSGGMVHSIAYNGDFGDYGATLILLHQLEGTSFYTLYGHISKKDIQQVSPGQYLSHGQEIAHFGEPSENGQWPPHLHFQVIADLGGRSGDYPGVCKYSERDQWLENCPDPDCILQLNKFLDNG